MTTNIETPNGPNVTESQITSRIEAIIGAMKKYQDYNTGIQALQEQVVLLSKFDTTTSRDLLKSCTAILKEVNGGSASIPSAPAATNPTGSPSPILTAITEKIQMHGHQGLLNNIKQTTLFPIINGLPPVSNFMLIYGLAGSGHERLAVATAQWLQEKVGSNGVYIAELNCFGGNGCKNRMWQTFSTSENLAKQLCPLCPADKRKAVKVIILLKDIDLISTEMQEELLAVSKSNDFPHVFFIATSSAPYNILPALRQRFFPRIFVNLPSATTMQSVLKDSLDDHLRASEKAKKILTGDDTVKIGIDPSMGNSFVRDLNDFLVYVATYRLGFKFANGDAAVNAVSKAVQKLNNNTEDGLVVDQVRSVVLGGDGNGYPSFSDRGRYQFGYNYEDIVDLAKLIYYRFTAEVNALTGDTPNCVYNTKNIEQFDLAEKQQQSLTLTRQQILPYDLNDRKQVLQKQLEDLTAEISELAKKSEVKEDESEDRPSQDESTLNNADEITQRQDTIYRQKIACTAESSSTCNVLLQDIVNHVNIAAMQSQCNTSAPKLDWDRLATIKTEALKAWVTDVVKESVSTVDPDEYLRLVRFEASMSMGLSMGQEAKRRGD